MYGTLQRLESPQAHRHYAALESASSSNLPGYESFSRSMEQHHDEMVRLFWAMESSGTGHAGIREIFEAECGHVKIDMAFFKRICELETAFVNKNPDHSEFFGGTRMGCHRVRMLQSDMDVIFMDFLGVDETSLENQIHELPDIDPTRNVSSSIFNIACVWLIHAFRNSPHLNDAQRLEGQVRVAQYLNYRFLTSILAHSFKFLTSPELADATYANLSYRFVLKATGSWWAALRYRSVELVKPGAVWSKTLDKLDNDYNVVKLLNDTQGRIRDMVKNIYEVFMDVHRQGSKINTISATVESDGEVILRDRVGGLERYSRYIRGVVPEKEEFIKRELLSVVNSLNPTAPEKLVIQMLEWTSANYLHVRDHSVEKCVAAIMEHAFAYLSQHQILRSAKTDLAEVLLKMRGTYTSSRATDERLLRVKADVEDLVRMAVKTKNSSVVFSIRTTFCLYVVARAFTMNHYLKR